MLFDARTLHTFIITARCKSFTSAAQQLYKVPNAVSYTIHKLEDKLGVSLFERDNKSLVLTEAGQFFYKKSQQMLTEFAGLKDATVQIASGYQAQLTISVNNIVSITPLYPLLQQSEKQFPLTEIKIAIDAHNGVWDALLNKRADLAIGAPNEIAVGDIATAPIGQTSWVFAISPQHPLAGATEPLSREMLCEYPAICIADTSVALEPKEAWLLPGQKAVIAPDYLHKIRMQIAGLGIGFLPRYFCQPYLQQGALVEKAVQYPKPDTPLFLAWNLNHVGQCQQWWLEQLQQPSLIQSWTQTPL
ncbi:MAG: LysR substrate-binding domain-containing protein [Enterobacteriaceae bacterium]